jgi:hypothetical protein
MLTTELYNIAKKFSLKLTKGDNFLSDELLHNALASCQQYNNWYKPFVMQCVYNSHLQIYNRGHSGGIKELRYTKNSYELTDENGNESMSSQLRQVDEMMSDQQELSHVYDFLTDIQKTVVTAYFNSDSQIEAAEMIKMNYETYKSHIKCVKHIFIYYKNNGILPKNTSDYINGYKKVKR